MFKILSKEFFQRHLKINYLLALFFVCTLCIQKLNAAVVITPASNGAAICLGTYTSLGNIVITEGANGDFSTGTNVTINLTAPSGFEFNPGTGSVTFAGGGNISAATVVVTASNITVTYTCSAINKPDALTISGIQIRANVLSAPTGNILSSAGTGVINGVTGATNFGTLTEAAPLTYASSTTTTVSGNINQGSTNNPIIGIQVVIGGTCPSINLTQLNLSTIGTTNAAGDITNAKIYYTGTSSTFATVGQFGSTIASPNGAFSVSGNQALQTGTNYFWLTYDIPASATVSNVLDAQCTQLTLNDGFGPRIPSVTNPAGNNPIVAPTVITVGASRMYTTIQAAYNALPATISNGYYIEVFSDYNPTIETYPVTFTNKSAGSFTITIRPAAGVTGLVCTGDPGTAAYLFNLNGAKNIIFDGRPGGAGTTGDFAIRNKRTATTVGGAFKFINDASYNELKYLNIEAEVTATLGNSIILFSTTTGTTGNSNNKINNCKIQDLTVAGTANLPYQGINSTGTAGKANKGNIIDNCEFVNIYNVAATYSSGVYISTGSDNWTITNNHFYQTASQASLNASYFFIYIDTGGGYTVNGNFIGGSAKNCGGAPYTLTSGTSNLYGIALVTTGITGAPCSIGGNTISNISITTTSTTVNLKPFSGIAFEGSADVYCGSNSLNGNFISGNTIGSQSISGSITITNNALSGSVGYDGIYCRATGTNTISQNVIAGITLNGTRAGAESVLIRCASTAGTVNVNGNLLGGSPGNILVSSDSPIYGIKNTQASGMRVSNNSISNFTHNASTQNFGLIINTTGPLDATGNDFNTITSTSTGAVGGNGGHTIISHYGASATTSNIDGNTIANINLTNATSRLIGIELSSSSACRVNGNFIGGTAANNISLAGNGDQQMIFKTGTGNLTATNNTVQNILLSSGGTATGFEGILCSQGGFTCNNNTIQNIFINSTSTSSFGSIYSSTSATGITISNNTLSNINLTNTGGVANLNLGLYLINGSGTITKNTISKISNASISVTARTVGLEVSTGTWDIFNNVILLDNNGASTSLTNSVALYGIECVTTSTVNIWHNTLKIYGSQASGTSFTSALYRTSTSGVHTIKNNIFQNLRTGGTGGHFAEYNTNGGGTYSSNYNYLEASNPSALCKWGAANQTLAGWQSFATAPNSITGTTTIDAIGKPSFPFIAAGKGTNLLASVTDDIQGMLRAPAPYIGAFEGPTIITSAISTSICQGSNINIAFTITGGYNAGNIFTAQISDASGSFASPTTLGTLNSQSAGSITGTIPALPFGAGYRIRVVSSNPIVIGGNNGSDLSITSATPGAVIANSATGANCSSFTANWSTATNATNYYLDVSTVNTFATFVPGYNNLNVGNVLSYSVKGLNSGTTYYYQVRAENGCGLSANSAYQSVAIGGTSQTYIVSSTANGTTSDGVSLRWAITQANANCGHDNIQFNLGIGPSTITLTTALPTLSDPDGVTIDGWSNGANPGSPNTIPVFNATTSTPLNPTYKIIISSTVASGLVLASDYNTIQGLVMQNIGDGTTNDGNDIAINISGNNNKILGCYLGIDVTGTNVSTRTSIGIQVSGANNQIGDGTAGGANLISGMIGSYRMAGIFLTGSTSSSNLIRGNIIGLRRDGASVVTGQTQDSGISFDVNTGSNNVVGGSLVGEGNVISGNASFGIDINNNNTSVNYVKGNIIGPQANGSSLVTGGTQLTGIWIGDTGGGSHVIGGVGAYEGNIISGNADEGIYLTQATINNRILGNIIGLNKTGDAIIPGSNQDNGIVITNASGGGNIIGGSSPGEGNVISGNQNGTNTCAGVYIASTTGNTIQGNIIGLGRDGISIIPSSAQAYGVYIYGSPNNIIGGNTPGARNIISSNFAAGVYISINGATGNSLKGNIIGSDKNGNLISSSKQSIGVLIGTSVGPNIIGGSAPGDGNIISCNDDGTSAGGIGIYLSNSSGGITIQGNNIGPSANGVNYISGNKQTDGIYINGSADNIIGGSSVGARNIVSGNENSGITIGAASTGNSIQGNIIGAGSSLLQISGATQDYGIKIQNGSTNNKVGGAGPGLANTISFNTTEGVYLNALGTTGNLISRNPIYSNNGKAINLNYGAAQANGGIPTPIINSATAGTVGGTANPNSIIELFKNNTSNPNDASVFVGTVNADASGNWSMAASVVNGDYVLATQTDGSKNTSEFTSALVPLGANSITTSALPTGPFCAGGSVSVSFTSTGTFNAGNVYSVQLSDATGSFAIPTDLTPTLSSTANTGTITVNYPAGANGTGYRVRVISSNPSTIGTDNGTNFTINTIPTAPSVTNGSNCGTGTVNLSASGSPSTYNWYTASTGGSSLATTATFTTPSISTTTTYYVTSANGVCESTPRTSVTATIKTIPSTPSVTNGSNCGTGTVNISASGSPSTYNWYTASTGGSSLATTASYTTPTISTTTTYYVTAVNAGCESTPRTPVVASINTIPSAPSVTNGSNCGTGTVNLSASGSPSTYNWYTASTGGSSQATTANYTTPSISTTTTYYVTSVNAGCESTPRTAVVATINTTPATPGTITGSTTVCSNQTNLNYSISSVAGATSYTWTLPSGASITAGASTTSITITMGVSMGNVSVQAVNTCGSSAMSNSFVSITPSPSITTQPTNTTICANANTNFTATASGSGLTYQWQEKIGAGPFNNITNGGVYSGVTTNTLSLIGIPAGMNTNQYRVIVSGTCTPSVTSTSATLTVNSTSTPIAGSNSPICIGSPINLTASSIAGAVYSWTGPNGFTSTSQNPTISSAAALNSGTYTVTAIVSGCTSSPVSTTVTINASQIADAGYNDTITSSTFTLNGNIPTSGTGTWTILSGSGTLTSPNSPTSSVTGMTLGLNKFIWSINDGACPVVRDTMSVMIYNNISNCSSSTPFFYVDLSSNPTGVWSSPSIARYGLCCSYSNPNTCVNFMVALEPSANGIVLDITSGTIPTGTLNDEADCGTPSVIASPVCFTGPAPHSVTFCKPGSNPNIYRITSIKVDPAGPITGPSSVCTNQTNVNYSIAPVNGATTYTWTLPAGSTIVAGTGTNSITVNFGGTPGNVCVTAKNGCGGSTPSCLPITINAGPSAPTAINGSNCGTGTVTLSAAGSSGTYNWYAASTGGSSLATSATYTTPSISATTTYYVTAVNAGCESSPRTSVLATINTIPSAPSVINGSNCGTGTVNISASGSPSTYNWYASSTGGSSLTTTATYTTPSISSTTTYYVTAVNAGCESSPRTSVTAAINSIPGASAPIKNAPFTVCANQTYGTYTVTLVPGATNYNWTLPTGATITSGAGTNNINVNFGTTSGDVCVSAQNTCGSGPQVCQAITVNTIPTAPSIITGPTTVCDSQTGVNYSISAIPGATTYNWSLPPGATITAGTGTTNITVNFASTPGNICVNAQNTCGTSAQSCQSITINSIPSTPSVTNGSNCGPGTVTLSASGSPSTYNWYTASTGGSSLATTATYTTPSISTTTTYYVTEVNGTCESSPRIAVTASINSIPTVPTGIGGSNCGTGTVNISATGSPDTYNWYNVSTGGSSLATTANFTTPVISNSTPYYVSAVSAAGCESASRTLVIASITSNVTPPSAINGSNCGTGSVTISASGSPGTYNWYNTSSGGSSIATTASYSTPSISSTTTYYVTAVSGSCESSPRTAVVATINSIPSAPTVIDGNTCGTGTVTIGASGSPATYNWYSALTGGTSLASTASFTTPSLSNSSTYYVSAVDMSGCESTPRTQVIATINPLPSSPTVKDASNCGPGSITITASGSPATYNWYTSETGGSSLATTANYTTPSISATTTYYVSAVSAAGCESAARSSVIATIDVVTNAGTLTSSQISDDKILLSLNGQVGSIIQWESAKDTNFTNPIISPITSNNDTVSRNTKMYYRVAIQSGSCALKYSNIIEVDSKMFILGKDIVPPGAISYFTASPHLPGFKYKWTYTGKNLFQLIPDSLNSYVVTILAIPSTKSGLLICKIYDQNGKFIDSTFKNIDIQVTTEAYTLKEMKCLPQTNDCSGNYINKFSIGSLKNESSGCSGGGYEDYTADNRYTTDIVLGELYNADINFVTAPGPNGRKPMTYVGLWIDFNNDGDFEDDQEFISSSYSSNNEIKLINLYISNNLNYTGQARLRVRTSTTAPFTKSDMCIIADDIGETEDYIVNIVNPSSLQLPQAITPNNDGLNDLFVIHGINPKASNSLLILDAMGNRVTEISEYKNDWPSNEEASTLNRGTYYYVFKNGSKTFKGYFIINY